MNYLENLDTTRLMFLTVGRKVWAHPVVLATRGSHRRHRRNGSSAVSQASVDRDDDFSRAGVVSMLAQPDTLKMFIFMCILLSYKNLRVLSWCLLLGLA